MSEPIKPNSLEGYTEADILAMATAYHQIASNPETRPVVLRAQKKLNPSANIPELDIEEKIAASNKERDAKLDAQETKILESEARERIREERDLLREQGFTGADVAEIEKLMIEEKKNGTVFTYETAANYYKNSRIVAQPTPHAQGVELTNSLPADFMAAAKKGTNALRGLARTEAGKALDDIRSGRIKLH